MHWINFQIKHTAVSQCSIVHTEWNWCGLLSLLGCVITIEMVREKVRVVEELCLFQ